jgi:hypothetical protein
MKPKLTLLLSLTFLFLFSGSVYGGVIDDTFVDVFDRKGEGVGLYCKLTSFRGYPSNFYMFISLRDKLIKVDTMSISDLHEGYYDTYKIVGENELYIKGQQKRI